MLKTCTTREILENQGTDGFVVVPTYSVAALLLQAYENNVDFLLRIIHIPTTRSMMRIFYLHLNEGENVQPGQAALLLAIFALSAFFYRPSEGSEVVNNELEAVHLARALGKATLNVLDHSRRTTSGTLADVQSYIFMTFLTFQLDGFSARGRLLSTSALSIARDLGLHQVDANPERSTNAQLNIRDLIDREVKRRVFWCIASTDWYGISAVGFVLNPHEYIGFNLPSPVHKKACISYNQPISKPISPKTAMTMTCS